MTRRIILAFAATFAALPVAAGDFEVDWWTIDSGGEIESGNGSWTLSGTVGQWDATREPLVGNSWTLEAGFWTGPVVEQRDDAIFRDRFDDEEPTP